MEAARGHWREVDKRAETVMEVTAGHAPKTRRGEPNLTPEQVEVRIDGVAKGGRDQRVEHAVISRIPAPGGLGRAERFSQPVQAVADLQNRVACRFGKDLVTGMPLAVPGKRRRDARTINAADGPASAGRALAAVWPGAGQFRRQGEHWW